MALSPHTQAPGRHFLPAFCLIAAIVFADQYTKFLVMETVLRVGDAAPPAFSAWFLTQQKFAAAMSFNAFRTLTLAPVLDLVLVWNRGISFGMMDGGSEMMSVAFIAVSLMVSMLMVIWLALTPSRLAALALALVVGGAVGNVIDRLRFSAVVDFIDLHVGDLHWPAFNLADSCIVAGALGLALHMMFGRVHDAPAEETA